MSFYNIIFLKNELKTKNNFIKRNEKLVKFNKNIKKNC